MPPKRRKLADGGEDYASEDDFDPIKTAKKEDELQKIALGKRRMDQQNSLDSMLKTRGAKID